MKRREGLCARAVGFLVATGLVMAGAPLPAAEEPFDYFENSWSVIGLKDYANATRITPANELLLATKIKARLSCGPNFTPLSRQQTKTLLDGWLPVVLLNTEEDGVRYQFKLWATPLPTVKDWRAAFAWPTEGENFLNWIEVKAINLGHSSKQARLRLDQVTSTNKIGALGEWSVTLAPARTAQTCFRIPFAPIQPPPVTRSSVTLSPSDGERSGVSAPKTINAYGALELGRDAFHRVPDIHFRDAKRSQGHGGTRPYRFMGGGGRRSSSAHAATSVAGQPFADESPKLWLDRTIRYWRNLLATGARIEVPCEKAMQALKAAHVQQFIDNDHGVLKGGEGFYDEFYIRDGAYQILQFEEAGFANAARKAVEPYLKSQRPDGRFETQKNQFDANGQALWTLWQYWKITGDREFLKRAYPQMRRAIEWIKQARRAAPSGATFAGVLPNAVADGEYLWDGKHHIVGYDFWNLRGLICAAEAAQALGETADAQAFRSEVDAYRQAIEATCQRSGLPHFPPSWEKVGTHWGNTETLWPTELFAANDPRVSASLREVREKFMGGFVEGTIRWSGFPDVIHPYMSSYTTMASLARGEHERFVEEFYWYLLHSTATHAFPEGIYYKKRIAWSDTIPHATGAANFAFLLRHALIHERGDELHLLSGVPDWWLEAGREIRVDNAPAHFGSLSLRVKGAAKGVEIKFTGPTRQPPKRIILHLPKSRPLAKPLKGAELDYRPDDTKRWDFPTVIEAYRSRTEVRADALRAGMREPLPK